MIVHFDKRVEKALQFAVEWLRKEGWNTRELVVAAIRTTSFNPDTEPIEEQIAQDMREDGCAEEEVQEFLKEQLEQDLFFWIEFWNGNQANQPMSSWDDGPHKPHSTEDFVEVQLGWSEEKETFTWLGCRHP